MTNINISTVRLDGRHPFKKPFEDNLRKLGLSRRPPASEKDLARVRSAGFFKELASAVDEFFGGMNRN